MSIMEDRHAFSSSGLTVAQLPNELKNLKLSCTGRKSTLKKRLDNYYWENPRNQNQEIHSNDGDRTHLSTTQLGPQTIIISPCSRDETMMAFCNCSCFQTLNTEIQSLRREIDNLKVTAVNYSTVKK